MLKFIQKIIVIVLDGAGIGETPDACDYGDAGSNTLVNIAKAVNGLSLPNMYKLGLANIVDFPFRFPEPYPEGFFGKAMEQSKGKDTTTGHWEIMGLITTDPFRVFTHGFPDEIIKRFEAAIGKRVIGNKPASGTVILEELGEQHIKTGMPIVYTSADSVFQIAAHENVIPVNELYDYCNIARKMLNPYNVGRVIARPFVGTPGHFKRTSRRKDFSMPPGSDTVLDLLKNHGLDVIGIGKIGDIFAGKGLTDSIHSADNNDGINKTIEAYRTIEHGIVFTNLVDFDTLYGHRNDVRGFKNALEEFDTRLKDLINIMDEQTMMIITADHGCDPTTQGTDHSREYIPILVYMNGIKGKSLGIRSSFTDIGKTILKTFSIHGDIKGTDFFDTLIQDRL